MKRKHHIGCQGKTSPIYENVCHYITRKYEKLFTEKIQPWTFYNCGADKFIEYYNGNKFNVGNNNMEFSGSIVDVYWEPFIRKFIEDDVQELVDYTAKLCRDRNLSPEQPLNETRTMLKQMAFNLFHNMAVIDRGIRGKGYPNKVTPVSIDRHVTWANTYIDKRVDGELKSDDLSEKINRFIHRYKVVYGIFMLILGGISTIMVKMIINSLTAPPAP